jgi:hypothetical protein
MVFVFVEPQPDIPLQLIQNKRVVVLDLDLGASLSSVVCAAASVFVIDHHTSTYQTLDAAYNQLAQCGYPQSRLQVYYHPTKEHSAASLTWKLVSRVESANFIVDETVHFTFEPEIPPQQPTSAVSNDNYPLLIRLVKMADTWTWDLEPNIHPREVFEAIQASRHLSTFAFIEQLHQQFSTIINVVDSPYYHSLMLHGSHILNYQDSLVKSIISKATVCSAMIQDNTTTALYTVLVVPTGGVLTSQIGHALRHLVAPKFESRAPMISFAVMWSYNAIRDEVYISLREPLPGIDLSFVAKHLVVPGRHEKAGGHEAAASLVVKGLMNLHQGFRPLLSFIGLNQPVHHARPSLPQQQQQQQSHTAIPTGFSVPHPTPQHVHPSFMSQSQSESYPYYIHTSHIDEFSGFSNTNSGVDVISSSSGSSVSSSSSTCSAAATTPAVQSSFKILKRTVIDSGSSSNTESKSGEYQTPRSQSPQSSHHFTSRYQHKAIPLQQSQHVSYAAVSQGRRSQYHYSGDPSVSSNSST